MDRRIAFLAAVLALPCLPASAALKARAIARISSLEGKSVGTVVFDAVNRGVLVTFDLHDLPPGPHAVHLHTSANCSIMQQTHLARRVVLGLATEP